MGKKVILLSGWYYPDSVGGTEQYVKLLSKALQASGWEAMIASPSTDDKESHYTYEGIVVYRYPISREPSKPEVRGEVEPAYFSYFADWVSKIKPDIVHMHSYTRTCGYYHALYVMRCKIPLVLTIHSPDVICVRGSMMKWGKKPCDGVLNSHRCAVCYLHMKGLPRPAGLIASLISQWFTSSHFIQENPLNKVLRTRRIINERIERFQKLLVMTRRIIVVCQWLEDILIANKISRDKVVLVRHGIIEKNKTGVGKNRDGARPLRVGFMGRFNPMKGIHILIEAVKRLPSNIPIEVRLYGRVNPQEGAGYYNTLKNSCKNDGRFLFCGEVAEEERSRLFSEINILAVPSIWLETGPYVVLEAFSEGVPVIGSRMGGISELVTHGVNGLLVEAGNVKAWSDVLKFIALHRECVEELASKVTVSQTEDYVLRKITALYENVLDETA